MPRRSRERVSLICEACWRETEMFYIPKVETTAERDQLVADVAESKGWRYYKLSGRARGPLHYQTSAEFLKKYR